MICVLQAWTLLRRVLGAVSSTQGSRAYHGGHSSGPVTAHKHAHPPFYAYTAQLMRDWRNNSAAWLVPCNTCFLHGLSLMEWKHCYAICYATNR